MIKQLTQHRKTKMKTKNNLVFLVSAAAPLLTLLLATASSSFAGSATWKAAPATGDWFTATNWTPTTVPNGPADTATFASSNKRRPFIAFNAEVNGIVFNPGASAFTIMNAPGTSPTFTISGVGITNNSGIVQNFAFELAGAQILFLNSATAGSLTAFTTTNMTFGGNSTAGNATFTNNGLVTFTNTATADDATFNNPSVLIFDGDSTAGNGTFTNPGFIQFGEVPGDASTAGNGTFTNPGSASSTIGGGLIVFHFGTAGDATFINDGATASDGIAGETLFQDTGDAGNAILIANGGTGGGDGGSIQFATASTGGTARVEVFGNGTLDISQHDSPGVTTGSIEGDGLVFLGGVNLTVGTNNLSTTFSGLMQDGGFSGGTGGSLTKAGKGKLTLSNASNYTGGTTVTKGTLLVRNTTGSATGTGAVQVNAGTLGGTGKITGAVTVGTGTTSGAILLAGNSATKPGTLTINSALTFNSLSTYKCVLSRTTVKASQVVGLGVTIKSGVPFTFLDIGTGTLATGTVFTVINNTSASPITGTFSNLASGSVFTSNGNNFQASYTGGTGNDLTLTVVP
jgi:autotransporter-associated beta strand protein